MPKPTMERIGYFAEESYLSIGDKYGEKKPPQSREKGPQMLSHTGKMGQTSDVTFQKFTTLWAGEKYTTLDETKRKDELDKKKKIVGSGVFVPANPPKEGSGLGGYYGTIGGKYPHVADTEYKQKRPEDVKHAMPNILTTGPKSGTFGVPGTTIGTYGTKLKTSGVVGEYTYASEPYDGAKEIEKERGTLEKTRFVTDKPFKPANPGKMGTYGVPGTILNSHSHHIVKGTTGVVGEYTYEIQGPAPSLTKKAASDEPARDAFRPSHPSKMGYNSTLERFPKYVEDPYERKEATMREEKQKERKKQVGPTFKSASFPKSKRTPSVLRMNVIRTTKR